MLKENHNAGVLMDRMDKKLVKTTNGLYQLLGPVTDAFPKLLYEGCVKYNGIPSGWKYFLTNAVTRKSITARNVHQYMIQEGATSNQKRIVCSDRDSLSKIDTYRIAVKQLTPLIAKTPVKLALYSKCNSPTDILRYKFHKKIIYMYKVMVNQIKEEDNIIDKVYLLIIILNF